MKMHPHRHIIHVSLWLVMTALVASSCKTTPKPPVKGWKEVSGGTFAFWIPPELNVGREPGQSFDYFYIYETPQGEQKPPTFYVYEGFSPKKFAMGKQGLVVKRSGAVRFGAFQGMENAGVDANGNYWREIHLRQPDALAIIHIWYFELPEQSAAEFDAIIRGIEMRQRKQ